MENFPYVWFEIVSGPGATETDGLDTLICNTTVIDLQFLGHNDRARLVTCILESLFLRGTSYFSDKKLRHPIK